LRQTLRRHPVREGLPFHPVYTEVTNAIRGYPGMVLRTGGVELHETRAEEAARFKRIN
jgi:hypothetical protein